VKNDLKRRQWALRRLKSTVTWHQFGAAAPTRVRNACSITTNKTSWLDLIFNKPNNPALCASPLR
jgi:hypothetical protein